MVNENDAPRTPLTDIVSDVADGLGWTVPTALRDLTLKVDAAVSGEKTEKPTDGDDIGPVSVVRAAKLHIGDVVYVEDVWGTVRDKQSGRSIITTQTLVLIVEVPNSFPAVLRYSMPVNRLMMIRPRP